MLLEGAVGWARSPRSLGMAHVPATLRDKGEQTASLVVLVGTH